MSNDQGDSIIVGANDSIHEKDAWPYLAIQPVPTGWPFQSAWGFSPIPSMPLFLWASTHGISFPFKDIVPVWRFLKKLEIELPYDPAIPLLGIHTEETRTERNTCTPMFIAALFVIARTWKQPRCPQADEWIRKLWYIYTMEYHSAIKKNTFESVLMRWVKLEPTIQSKVSQKGKHQYSTPMHIYGI